MASHALEDQAHVEHYISVPSRVIPMVTYSKEVLLLDFRLISESLTKQGKAVVLDSRAAMVALHWSGQFLPYPFKALHNGSSLETVNLEYSILCNALAEVGRKIVDKQSAELDQTIVELQSLEKQPPALTSRRYLYMPQCPMCGRARLFVRALQARP